MSRRRELVDLLEQVPLLSRCSQRERATVARFMETADLPAGTDLIVEGEAGDALFVIIDGEAAIRRGGVEVATVGEGAHFGELAILDGGPRSATVVATTDVRVAVLGIRMFRTLLREIPDLAEQLMVGLAGELRRAQAAATSVSA